MWNLARDGGPGCNEAYVPTEGAADAAEPGIKALWWS